jgi:hypothetical protein
VTSEHREYIKDGNFTKCREHLVHAYPSKKGSSVHIAPACAGSEEGSDHFRSYVRSLSLYFCKRLLPGLDHMISWSQQLYRCARVPLLVQYANSKYELLDTLLID